MSVALASGNAPHRRSAKSEAPRRFGLRNAIRQHFADIRNEVVWNLGVPAIDGLSAVVAPALAVRGVTFIAEIAKGVIGSVAVQMRRLASFWRGSDERLQNQAMHGQHLSLLIAAEVHGKVAVALHDRAEKPARILVVAEDAAQVGNEIKAIVSDNGFERLEHAPEYHKSARMARFGQVGRVMVTPEMVAA